MADLRLDWIAARTGGTIAQGPPALHFAAFGIDSRRTLPGELFFAIPAVRDGHDFVAAAAAAGAAGAVVSRPVSGLPPGFALLLVPDTVRALQALARAVRLERAVRVVGVTGSVGKTTTKEFTAALLEGRFRVLKSEANLNNQLGLALSLLRLEPGHTAAVLEMAMRAPGEIAELAAVAAPDVAVITNVNPVHLEFLKTLDAVAEAKWEIVSGLNPGGTAVLNGDDPRLRERAGRFAGRRLLFGRGPGCDVTASSVRRLGFEGFAFVLEAGGRSEPARLAFPSEAYLENALAAAAAAWALDVPLSDIAAGLAGLRPAPGRGQWRKLRDGIILVDDSYNSNPAALRTALREWAALPARRRVAVLGDMLELGADEAAFHRDAGREAARAGWDVLVTAGPLARLMAEAAVEAGMDPAAVRICASGAEAAETAAALIRPGDLVLVKGSRGARTELVVRAVQDRFKES